MTENNRQEEIQKNLQTLLKDIQSEVDDMESKRELYKQEMEEFQKIKKKLETVSSQAKNKIKLNVGGTTFMTSLNTLTMEKNTFFSSMFSEEFNTQPDEEGEYFIDRDPEHFRLILDCLRNPTKEVNLSEMTKKQLEDFYFEVDFYSIHSLMKKIPDTPKFDVLKIGKNLSFERLSENKFRITRGNTTAWDANVIFTSCKSWKITMINNCNAMCGVVDKDSVLIDGRNFDSTGYYVYAAGGTGSKYSVGGVSNQSYAASLNKDNGTATFRFENGNLSCIINGKSYDNAYTGLNTDLVPSFDVCTSGAVFDVEFLE